ncbi:unnamed protein product [Caenorhabditis angaria]|uniref:THAP-type domain-containing protein n=1 Tax=Caenorhabditis angaria TaxID=860376 RepID=A0A9P1J2I3_9PELO|nr:unnamed protein product [Caenorhabditis angaria]
MTNVTKNEIQLKKWVDILGPEFAANIKDRKQPPLICRIHFDNLDNSKIRDWCELPRKDENVDFLVPKNPMKKEKIIKKSAKTPKQIDIPEVEIVGEGEDDETPRIVSAECRVCERHRKVKNMTEVPKDFDKLLKWLKVFGEEFYKNLKANDGQNFICLVHLKDILEKLA